MKLTEDRIYRLLRTVPPGKVTTYKALATALGSRAYRYIGQVMKKNPDAPRTPCHRVVSTGGMIGGYMGQTHGVTIQKKIDMLRHEGVRVRDGKIINFDKVCITSFPK